MTATTSIDQVQLGKDRLVTQWADKTTVQGLLKSYTENVQTVEDVYGQLLNERSVFTAIGVQLDVIGTIVGEVRNGKTDEPYRQAILNRIAINRANGTPENIMTLLKTITGSTTATIFEHYPANVHAHISGSPSNATADTLVGITPAGVSARLMFDGGVKSYIGATAQQAFFDIALENNDELELENGDFLGGVDILVLPFEDNSVSPAVNRSFFPHTLDTGIINPLCALFVGTTPTA